MRGRRGRGKGTKRRREKETPPHGRRRPPLSRNYFSSKVCNITTTTTGRARLVANKLNVTGSTPRQERKKSEETGSVNRGEMWMVVEGKELGKRIESI